MWIDEKRKAPIVDFLGWLLFISVFAQIVMLIIEPARPENGGEFAEQILSDLITEGYSGQELLSEFKSRQSQVRPAVEEMLKAAKDAANGIGKYYSYSDVFGGKQ